MLLLLAAPAGGAHERGALELAGGKGDAARATRIHALGIGAAAAHRALADGAHVDVCRCGCGGVECATGSIP